jgi:tRNA(fMet)-specific endonuclease VapC
MKFLLDTTTISDWLRGEQGVVARITGQEPAELAITAVSVMELRYGAARKASRRLDTAIDAVLAGIAVLAFDGSAAQRAGRLRAAMEASGISIALADCQIAGTALTAGLILVSSDSGMARVPGLTVQDWRLRLKRRPPPPPPARR